MARNIDYTIVFVKLNSFFINATMCDPVHDAETIHGLLSEICSLQGITHIYKRIVSAFVH